MRPLLIHDALAARITTRELAFFVAFKPAPPIARATWKSSEERRQTLRSIAEARGQQGSGHLNLLRRGQG